MPRCTTPSPCRYSSGILQQYLDNTVSPTSCGEVYTELLLMPEQPSCDALTAPAPATSTTATAPSPLPDGEEHYNPTTASTTSITTTTTTTTTTTATAAATATATTTSRGRWSTAEHAAFVDGLYRYGRQWTRIAAIIQTRTGLQTRTHAQKYFARLAKEGHDTVAIQALLKSKRAETTVPKRARGRAAASTTSALPPSSVAASGRRTRQGTRQGTRQTGTNTVPAAVASAAVLAAFTASSSSPQRAATSVQGKKATLAGKRPLPPVGVATATIASRPTIDTSRSASSRGAKGGNGPNGGAAKRQRRCRVREDPRAADDVEAAQVLIGLLSGSSDEGDEGDEGGEEGTGDRSDMDVHGRFFGGEHGDTGGLAHAAEMLMGAGTTSDSFSSFVHSSSSSASSSSSFLDSALHLTPPPVAWPWRPVEAAQQQQQQQQQVDLLPSKGKSTEWGMGPRDQSKENLEALFAANRPAFASLDHDAPFVATSRLAAAQEMFSNRMGALGGKALAH